MNRFHSIARKVFSWFTGVMAAICLLITLIGIAEEDGVQGSIKFIFNLSLLFAVPAIIIAIVAIKEWISELKKNGLTINSYLKTTKKKISTSQINNTGSLSNQLLNGGFCGIKIGDNYKMVLSRMVHLGLINKEESDKYRKEYEEWNMFNQFKSTLKLKGVDNIIFSVSMHNGRLDYIYIDVFKNEDGLKTIDTMYQSLCKNHGTPLFDKESNLLNWKDRTSNVVYTISPEGLIIGEGW